jgi:hypothetical protein
MTGTSSPPDVVVHGHAIVSADDRIATADGRMPASLMNDADWTIFQSALDRAALCVLGRLGHEAHPNLRGRPRLIVSSGVEKLQFRGDAWWWNPAGVDWATIAQLLLPDGGLVAVPGGQRVFDLFLGIGYDEFHLARARGALIPDGRPLFSACLGAGHPGKIATVEEILAASGLCPGETRLIDAAADVERTIWSRPGTAG